MLWVCQKGHSKSRWEGLSQMRTSYQWHLDFSGETATWCCRRWPRGRSSSVAYSRVVPAARGTGQAIRKAFYGSAQLLSWSLAWRQAEAPSPLRGRVLPTGTCSAKQNHRALPLQAGKGVVRKKKPDFHLPVLILALHKSFWPPLCNSGEISNDSLSPGPKIKAPLRKAEGMHSPWWDVNITHCTGIPYPHYIGP